MFRMDVYFHSDEIGNEALRFNIALAIDRAECWQKHTFRSSVPQLKHTGLGLTQPRFQPQPITSTLNLALQREARKADKHHKAARRLRRRGRAGVGLPTGSSTLTILIIK